MFLVLNKKYSGLFAQGSGNMYPLLYYSLSRRLFVSRILLVCCLVLILVSPVLAVEKDFYPYAGLTAGALLTPACRFSDNSGSLDAEFDPGYLAGMQAGVAFDPYIGLNIERVRIEAEVGYRSSNLSRIRNVAGNKTNVNSKLTIKDIMINGYLDNTAMLSKDEPVTLFITAGVGIASASLDTVSYQGIGIINSGNDSQLAYQGGIGVGYGLTSNITFDVTYKYMATAPFRFNDVKADYSSHNIILGLWYAFK